MSDRSSGEVMLAFLLGGIVGACVGVLFAPSSGKETRKKLKDMAEDIGEKAEGMIGEGKDKMEEIVKILLEKETIEKEEFDALFEK